MPNSRIEYFFTRNLSLREGLQAKIRSRYHEYVVEVQIINKLYLFRFISSRAALDFFYQCPQYLERLKKQPVPFVLASPTGAHIKALGVDIPGFQSLHRLGLN